MLEGFSFMPDAPGGTVSVVDPWSVTLKDMSQRCDIISPTPGRQTARTTECRTAELLPFYLCALFSSVLEAGFTFTPSQTVEGMAPCLSLSAFSRSLAILLDLTPRLSASRAQPEPPLGAELRNLSSSRAAHFTGNLSFLSAKRRVCMHCRGAAVNPQQQQMFEIDVYRSAIWALPSAL
jgi:hypothetical protein